MAGPENERLGVTERSPQGSESSLSDLEWLTRLFDASPLGVCVSDAQDRCVYANAAYCQIAGLAVEQALGMVWSSMVHPDDRRRISTEWLEASRDQRPFQAEARFLRGDGSVVWTRLHTAIMQGQKAQSTSLLVVEDISARKAAEAALQSAEEALFAEKERAQVTLDSIGDAVLTTDMAGNLTYLNREAEKMTGWPRDEALGRPLAEVFHIIDGTTRAPAANPATLAVKENRTVGLAMGCVLVRRDGSEVLIEDSAAPIHDRDGQVAGAVIVFHDLVQSRAMAERMAHLARHDFLTGLPNPAMLNERLGQATSLARRHGKRVALLFIDMDDFKVVNDTLGHMAGDQLLQSVSEQLVGCVRNSDTVCRRGGDEFVILLTEIEHPRDAGCVAEKLLRAMSRPQVIDGIKVQISASVGISVYPDDSEDEAALFGFADAAMYQAKAYGPGGYRFFGAGMPGWRDLRQEATRPGRPHRQALGGWAGGMPKHLQLDD